MTAINGFLSDTVVLPPGEWDRNVLLPILIEQSRALARRKKMAKAGKSLIRLSNREPRSHALPYMVHRKSILNFAFANMF